jgi:hypothetical protein
MMPPAASISGAAFHHHAAPPNVVYPAYVVYPTHNPSQGFDFGGGVSPTCRPLEPCLNYQQPLPQLRFQRRRFTHMPPPRTSFTPQSTPPATSIMEAAFHPHAASLAPRLHPPSWLPPSVSNSRGGISPTCCPPFYLIYPPNNRGGFAPMASNSGGQRCTHMPPPCTSFSPPTTPPASLNSRAAFHLHAPSSNLIYPPPP